MDDNSIWTTGLNLYGQLGLGDNTYRNTLTQITSEISGCTPQSIFCGGSDSMVLMTNNSIWSTGYNLYGQLGLGDNDNRNTLTKITSDFSGCTPQSISCGGSNSMVLMTDSSIWTTGLNSNGQLGLGDNNNRNTLTKITRDISGCTPQNIECSATHNVALMTNGTIWATGGNSTGQLGIGNFDEKNILTKMTTNNSNFMYIADMYIPITTSDICFPAGTPVLTDQGIISIDLLIPDLHTINQKPIVDITKTKSSDYHLVEFNKDAFGPNCPHDKVIVTKEHMIQYQGKMYAAKTFVENFDVELIAYNGEILYNVLLDEHSTMNINGLICETLHPDNLIAKLYTKQCKLDVATRQHYICSLIECVKKNDYEEYNRIVQLC